MKKNHLLYILLLITTISSCQNNLKNNNNQKHVIKENQDCEIFYNKYIEKISIRENDSALFYIDKSIKCDTTNRDYKFSKVQFLISIKDYKASILVLDGLHPDVKDPTLKMLKGILKLKLNDPSSKKILEECYIEFKELKSPTPNNQFYKIALDNYFTGKEYALKEIEKVKQIYKDQPYESQNFKALEELINTKKKEFVLFKLFNIIID